MEVDVVRVVGDCPDAQAGVKVDVLWLTKVDDLLIVEDTVLEDLVVDDVDEDVLEEEVVTVDEVVVGVQAVIVFVTLEVVQCCVKQWTLYQ